MTRSSRTVIQRFCDFFFAPGDPTTIGFMRIVTGSLVLYVMIAYCWDLTLFFGENGWNSLESVNRSRHEEPGYRFPLDWEVPPDVPGVDPEYQKYYNKPRPRKAGVESILRITMPQRPFRREAVIAYIRKVTTEHPDPSSLNASLKILKRHEVATTPSGGSGNMQELIQFIMNLSHDEVIRKNQLSTIRNSAFFDPQRDANRPPSFVQNLTSLELRAEIADEIETFFKTLPPRVHEREQDDPQRYVLYYIWELAPHYRGRFYQMLEELVSATPEERERKIDHLAYWGIEERELLRRGRPIHSIWFHITDPTEMRIAHGCVIVIVTLFTIGLWTRVTSVLTWLAAIAYIHRSQQVLFGMDTMSNILLIYLMIGDCGAALSVDRWLKKRRAIKLSLARSGTIDAATKAYLDRPPDNIASGFAQRMLQIHFCFIYMAAGLSKLKGASWWNTNAYWDTLVNPEFTLIHYQWYENLIREVISNRIVYSLCAAAGVGVTFIAEIGLPFLVWTRMRPYIVIFGFLLHAGVAVFMGLWVFSLLMMTLLLCYLPGSAIRAQLFRR